MAPPTGRRGGSASNPPRRATHRGGVGKRRPPARTDRDGDVSMDGPDTGRGGPSQRTGPAGRGGGRARGGRSTRASSRLSENVKNYFGESGGHGHAPPTDGQSRRYTSKPGPLANKTTLKILGLKDSKAASNPDGGLGSLLEFLERKSAKFRDKPITVDKGELHGDYVFVTVNKDDAQYLLRLDGYTYAGAALAIKEEVAEPMPDLKISSPAALDTRQKLTAVLKRRYNAQQELLDLSALGTDETLVSLGTFGSLALAEKSFRALMHILAQQYKDPLEKEAAIQAVSLAGNEIQDVSQVFTLAQRLPRLRRLDLSGNKLEDPSKLSKWRHEFRYMEELHLAGNPIVNQPSYPTAIIKWFPSLQILDGQQVRTPEEAAAALEAWFPSPLPQLPSNLRDGENNVASIFLRAAFPLYDHDRSSLVAQFYDDESLFSLTILSASESDLSAKPYLKYSRNAKTLGSRNPSTLQRLFAGGNLVAELWKTLPVTRHPSLDQPDQWLVDCHTFPNLADPAGQGFAMGLIIDAHGRFEEAALAEDLFGTRLFSRCFILGPSKPGAPHPYRVISDQLVLHGWTRQEPDFGVQAPAVSSTPAVPVVAGGPVLDDAMRAQMIQELSARTGMNAEYSELCLAGAANWNFDMALKSFEEQKANLPATAFLSPA